MQRILQEIEKKIILETSDAWSTIRLSHRPSNPAYYIVNWRIFRDINAWKERVGFVAPKPKPVESKVCPFCAGTFKSLEQHIKYKHESEKPWKCDKCDFAHATKIGLKVR